VSTLLSRSTLAAALLLAMPFAAAADLRPDQKAAVDKILATMEPSMRQMVRPQMEQSISMMTPEQVAMFVASATAGQERQQEAVEEESSSEASPEDLAYNRAQIEPVLRKHWKAKKEFDEFVDAELAAKCPNPDKYAVYREVERYELMPVGANWHRAHDHMETEVQIIAGTYPPQDGRYDFDFSKVRMTFDKSAVSSAIEKACADWTKEAIAFKEKASKLMYAGDSDAAFKLERAAGSKVSAINSGLEAALNEQAPSANYNAAMMEALQNPKRVK
jgi:hypothetical protein